MQDLQDLSHDASCGLCNGPMPCSCSDNRTKEEREAEYEEQQDMEDLCDRYGETLD